MKTSTVKPHFYVVIGSDPDSSDEDYADIEFSLKDCQRSHPTIIIPVRCDYKKRAKYTGTVLPLQTLK